MARAARFAVAWLNNFSLEIDRAQQVAMPTFLTGAPWARQFFQHNARAIGSQGGRPSIRDADELTLKVAIDAYSETLLQWLQQISANTGTGFDQELFNPEVLRRNSSYENELALVVRGSARPSRQEQDDTIEAIKVQMDGLARDELPIKGVAGLADILWSLSL
jgi:hypothetical protein